MTNSSAASQCAQELREWGGRLHALLLEAASKLGQAHAVLYFGFARLRSLAAAAQQLVEAASEAGQVPVPMPSTAACQRLSLCMHPVQLPWRAAKPLNSSSAVCTGTWNVL